MNKIVFLAAMTTLLATSANAATLVVDYETTPIDAFGLLAPSDSSSAVSAGNFSTAPGLFPNSLLTPGTPLLEIVYSGGNVGQTGPDTPIDDDYEAFFGFTVDDNVSIDLTTLEIRIGRGIDGPLNVHFGASINSDPQITLPGHTFADVAGSSDVVIDLSALPTLMQGDSIEFEIEPFNIEASSNNEFILGTIDFGGSDPRAIRIEGTVSQVPEPSGLVGLGLAGLALWSRRKRNGDRAL